MVAQAGWITCSFTLIIKNMSIKTTAEIELMKESALLTSRTLATLAAFIKPGITTLTLDKLANEFIRDHGATPSFYKYNGFPFHICTSVNDAVVHGIPNDIPLQEGDVLSLDAGAYKNGYHGDQAYTFVIGQAPEHILQLVGVTKESLAKGIAKAIHGNRVGDIGYAVQSHAESHGYGVVRALTGHGLGKKLHEKPDVPNFGRQGQGVMLKENLVISIEPMINLQTARVFTGADDWTILTADGQPSAHFEENVCVKKNSPLVLSDFSIIAAAEKANPYLNTGHLLSPTC
jgi:methionyl aminopeptidase